MGSLTITYQPPGKWPVSVVTVEDESLLREAAHHAVEQAEQRAVAAATEDPVSGMLQAAEVRRLRAVVAILVPGFTSSVRDGIH